VNLIEAAAIAESAGGSVAAQFSIFGVDAEDTAHRIAVAAKSEARHHEGPGGTAWIVSAGNVTYVIGEE
jgi:hypothetical protein